MRSHLEHTFKWTGRVDGSLKSDLRWHQIVRYVGLYDMSTYQNHWGIIGFPSDEGVRRNQGRIGAADGPKHIRKACCNLPVFNSDQIILDFGDIVIDGNSLEDHQKKLIEVVSQFHQHGLKSIVLGGGHEITYPHFTGIQQANPSKSIGIINIDAHFDLREVSAHVGSTSGTGFWEIYQSNGSIKYLILGVQQMSNTSTLFDRANEYGVHQIEASTFDSNQTEYIISTIQQFIQSVDLIYVSLDMDVFSAAFAPGVSAPASFGLIPNNEFRRVLNYIKNQPTIVAFDIAELNPAFDLDSRTAKLAASCLFDWLK